MPLAPDRAQLARNLRTWRGAARLRQETAAVMAGLTLVKLQRVERGEARLDVLQMRALAGLYGQQWTQALDEVSSPADEVLVPSLVVLSHPLSHVPVDAASLAPLGVVRQLSKTGPFWIWRNR